MNKLNIDGTNKENPMEREHHFCIRDHKKDLLYEQTKVLRNDTNIQAEDRAAYEALKYSVTKGFQGMTIETNFLTLKNMMQRV